MNALREQAPAPIHLSDYRAPAWRVDTVDLDFDLGIGSSEVVARLRLHRDPAQQQPLRLDGEGLELLSMPRSKSSSTASTRQAGAR